MTLIAGLIILVLPAWGAGGPDAARPSAAPGAEGFRHRRQELLAPFEEAWSARKPVERSSAAVAACLAKTPWSEVARSSVFQAHRDLLIARLVCDKDLSWCEGAGMEEAPEVCEEVKLVRCMGEVGAKAPGRSACRSYFRHFPELRRRRGPGKDPKFFYEERAKDEAALDHTVALFASAVLEGSPDYCRSYARPGFLDECLVRFGFARSGEAACHRVDEHCVMHHCVSGARTLAALAAPDERLCGGDLFCLALLAGKEACGNNPVRGTADLARLHCLYPDWAGRERAALRIHRAATRAFRALEELQEELSSARDGEQGAARAALEEERGRLVADKEAVVARVRSIYRELPHHRLPSHAVRDALPPFSLDETSHVTH